MHTYIRSYSCAQIQAYVHKYICTQIHMYTNSYVYIRVHIQSYKCSLILVSTRQLSKQIKTDYFK